MIHKDFGPVFGDFEGDNRDSTAQGGKGIYQKHFE